MVLPVALAVKLGTRSGEGHRHPCEGASLVEAMARRRSPDRLLAEAIQVLGEYVRDSVDVPLHEMETHSQRLTALAKAVQALNQVESARWAAWSPQRLRNMSEEELAGYLAAEAMPSERRGLQ